MLHIVQTSQTYIRATDAAALLEVHIGTLRRWADDGRIRSVRSPGGTRRYFRAEIERIASEMAQEAS